MLSPRLGAPYAYMLYGLRGAKAFHQGQHGDFALVGVPIRQCRQIPESHDNFTVFRPKPFPFPVRHHDVGGSDRNFADAAAGQESGFCRNAWRD
jgi:hypothetical protein